MTTAMRKTSWIAGKWREVAQVSAFAQKRVRRSGTAQEIARDIAEAAWAATGSPVGWDDFEVDPRAIEKTWDRAAAICWEVAERSPAAPRRRRSAWRSAAVDAWKVCEEMSWEMGARMVALGRAEVRPSEGK